MYIEGILHLFRIIIKGEEISSISSAFTQSGTSTPVESDDESYQDIQFSPSRTKRGSLSLRKSVPKPKHKHNVIDEDVHEFR